MENSSPRISCNCGSTESRYSFGSIGILWSWSKSFVRWSIHLVATRRISILEMSTVSATGNAFFSSTNARFTPCILLLSRSFAARLCRLTPVSIRFLRLFSFRLPCWRTGLPIFSKSPSPLVEDCDEVGEFCIWSEQGKLLSTSSSHDQEGSSFTTDICELLHVERVNIVCWQRRVKNAYK